MSKKLQVGDLGPLFFHAPSGPTQKPMARRPSQRRNPHGDQPPPIPLLIGGGLHGAEPTFDPALLPAADNRPAFARGGLPATDTLTTPLCQQ